MNIRCATTLLLTSLFLTYGAFTAYAKDLKPVSGDYVVSQTERGAHKEFGLIVRGQAAEEIYAALPFKAKPDICTGGMKKSDPKGIFCIKQKSDFTCSMGINLKTRKVTAGPLTC